MICSRRFPTGRSCVLSALSKEVKGFRKSEGDWGLHRARQAHPMCCGDLNAKMMGISGKVYNAPSISRERDRGPRHGPLPHARRPCFCTALLH